MGTYREIWFDMRMLAKGRGEWFFFHHTIKIINLCFHEGD